MNKEKLRKLLSEETNMEFAVLLAFAGFVLGVSLTLMITHGTIVGLIALAVSGYGFKVVSDQLSKVL